MNIYKYHKNNLLSSVFVVFLLYIKQIQSINDKHSQIKVAYIRL